MAKRTSSKNKDGIEKTDLKTEITTNILLIAPHGFSKDDKNTGKIARHMAKKLKCHAVINEVYRKPPQKRDKTTGEVLKDPKTDKPLREPPDKGKKWIDLNDLDQVRNHLTDEFLQPILKRKDKIVDKYGTALVVLIHGIDDDHIKDEAMEMGVQDDIEILIGIGQPNRYSVDQAIADKLIKILNPNGHRSIKAVLARENSDYAGWDRRNVNQLFTPRNNDDSRVQSIQLEIKCKEFRDTASNIEKTADILSNALSKLTQEKQEEGETMQAKEKLELKPITGEVDIDTIKVDTKEDRKYIFRENLAGDNEYQRMLEAEIEELAQSIEKNTLIHRLVLLQKEDGTYIILCGYRRYQALRKLEREKVPAEIYKEKDLAEEQCMELSLAENTKRRNLNPIEIGKYLNSIREQSQAKGKRLSYEELASQYGKKLGIGESFMSVKQYLMLYELWRDDKSRELVNDIFKDKVQFGLAVALSFIEDPNDRNALYEKLVKQLELTRPALTEIKKLLDKIAKDEFLSKKYGIDYTAILENKEFKTAIETASSAENKGSEFIRQVNLLLNDISAHKNKGFSDRVETLLYSIFEKKVDPEDFSITPSPGMEKPEVTFQFKIKKEDMKETIDHIKKLLEKEQDIAEIIDYTVTTPKEIEDLI